MNIRQFFGHASDMAAIRALMMRYKLAIDEANVEMVMQCHADVDDISAVSLDATYSGKKAVRAFFERLFSPAVREDQSRPPSSTHVAIHHDTAVLVFEHEMRLRQPKTEILDCRVTFTLIRIESEWRILHSHVSVPRAAFVDVGEAAH